MDYGSRNKMEGKPPHLFFFAMVKGELVVNSGALDVFYQVKGGDDYTVNWVVTIAVSWMSFYQVNGVVNSEVLDVFYQFYNTT
ncbi:hypothetical protein Hamer_G003760 [Homarus americanus]|uniref:Uncharacterized protein n=1 Tax=Homarus americanus TaxID=6706 RepID=A0A8J5NE85_HOMAM|nr:hypothetical protein Hamer_G003760 [Homarus americanus]